MSDTEDDFENMIIDMGEGEDPITIHELRENNQALIQQLGGSPPTQAIVNGVFYNLDEFGAPVSRVEVSE